MTGTPAYSPEPVGHWVAARHGELLDGLGQYLDPDAGLRDIMLHADHVGVVGTLGSHLDTQAGLAAILPPSTETAAAIAAVDPAVRITLRHHPVMLAAILSDLTVRALMVVDKARAARERDLARGLNRDLNSAHDLASALDRDLDRARALSLNRDLDPALTPDLADARDLAHAYVLALARDLDRARDLALDLASVLARDLTLVLDVVLALTPAIVLASARDLAIDLADARASVLTSASALNRASVLASVLAHQTALMVSDALGIRQTKELAEALLAGALDDFTRADLAHADLTGCDLTGIRWSDWGTQWPPGTDTDALRAQSREVADGSGIYVIRGPGHGDKARRYTRT